jgi:hypothetical protein
MATKTYIDLVNDVLDRLREDRVGTVSYSPYSRLIGAYVNDAKRLCEDSWDWQALTSAVSVLISPGVQDYTLTGLNERARLLKDPENPHKPMAYDTTAGDTGQLVQKTMDWVRRERALTNDLTIGYAKPTTFGVTKTAGGILLSTLEIPTDVRLWTLYFCDPQDDLSVDTDELRIPYAPIVMIALDYALNERGEEIGEPGTTVERKALTHIANATAIDAQEQAHKTTFYPG